VRRCRSTRVFTDYPLPRPERCHLRSGHSSLHEAGPSGGGLHWRRRGYSGRAVQNGVIDGAEADAECRPFRGARA
jgi:hypothetical protein